MPLVNFVVAVTDTIAAELIITLCMSVSALFSPRAVGERPAKAMIGMLCSAKQGAQTKVLPMIHGGAELPFEQRTCQALSPRMLSYTLVVDADYGGNKVRRNTR